jgi:hypothetical protein
MPTDDTAKVEVRIENIGRGIASFVGFVILSGNGLGASTLLPEPLLYPGQHHRSKLPFTTATNATGMVYCEDRHGAIHTWSAHRRHRIYREGTVTDANNLFKDLYPESDLESVTLLPSTPLG